MDVQLNSGLTAQRAASPSQHSFSQANGLRYASFDHSYDAVHFGKKSNKEKKAEREAKKEAEKTLKKEAIEYLKEHNFLFTDDPKPKELRRAIANAVAKTKPEILGKNEKKQKKALKDPDTRYEKFIDALRDKDVVGKEERLNKKESKDSKEVQKAGIKLLQSLGLIEGKADTATSETDKAQGTEASKETGATQEAQGATPADQAQQPGDQQPQTEPAAAPANQSSPLWTFAKWGGAGVISAAAGLLLTAVPFAMIPLVGLGGILLLVGIYKGWQAKNAKPPENQDPSSNNPPTNPGS